MPLPLAVPWWGLRACRDSDVTTFKFQTPVMELDLGYEVAVNLKLEALVINSACKLFAEASTKGNGTDYVELARPMFQHEREQCEKKRKRQEEKNAEKQATRDSNVTEVQDAEPVDCEDPNNEQRDMEQFAKRLCKHILR